MVQACLEYRRLLQILTGMLASPNKDLTLRAVAMDLIYTQALKEHLANFLRRERLWSTISRR